VLQALWILGFLVGTTTHLIDLVSGGLDVYSGFPPGVRVFWVALTVLDPAVVVLVALRQRAGLALGAVVMVADVAVNATVFAVVGGLSPFGLVSQSVFALFVLGTAPVLWRGFRSSRLRRRPPHAARER
jgi:hypothetical protein